MKRIWIHCWVIVSMLVGLSCSCASERKAIPTAQDGILDLRDWDFEKDGNIDLSGEWLFVWEEFVEPMPIQKFREKYRGTIQIPAPWHTQPHPNKPGEMLPVDGYASYVLEIHLPPDVERPELGIATADLNSAATWFITSADATTEFGKLHQGTPGRSLTTTSPVRIQVSTALTPSNTASMVVFVHISNFRIARSGTFAAPRLGTRHLISQAEKSEHIFNAIVFGICWIIALYHLILFMQRREDKPSLFFAFFCSSFALLQWVSSNFSEEIGLGLSPDGFEMRLALEYAAMPLIGMSGALFIHELVPGRLFKRFIQVWYIGFSAILLLPLPIVSSRVYTDYLGLYEIHILGGAAVVLGHLIRNSMAGHRMARWVSLALTVLLVGGVNDIFLGRGFIQSVMIAPHTFIIFILMQSGILSGLAARAFRRSEHLSANLQKEVKDQTHDLTVKTLEAQEATQEALLAKSEAEAARLEADKLREEAERHAEDLRELDTQKTAFFQNMSHELRTPLTLILNPLENQAKAQPGNKEIEVATKNSRRLLRLVNQLLDFQKLEAGKQELKLGPVNASQFIHTCGDYFASACSSKKVQFSTISNSEVMGETRHPVYILSEVDALEKVTFNFLSNALKFTPKGGTIELGLTATDEMARIFIRDTGPGISEEGQQKLFQVFSQVDETTTRQYEGTGLGLALVKSLAEEMNGNVGIESEVGNGSTFWVEFPLCDAPETEIELDFEVKDWLLADGTGETGLEDTGVFQALEDITEGDGELVLVVDDLPDMRDLISNSLKKRSYRIATAPNGKRGVEIAQQIRPNLIITDWMMPLMSGPDLIKEVKALGNGLSSVPIILLTAKSDEESKLIGTEIGADAFLGKPFNDQELCSIVRNLLSLKTREREVEDLNKLLTESVLKRYLPPELVDQIVSGETSLEQEPKGVTATILFSDLVGFTQLSGRLRAQKLARVLNEYLTVMNDVVYEYGGTVDKFIGDAIMVIFGAPTESNTRDQADQAARCALAMQAAMLGLNKKWMEEGLTELKMRIGIHQGPLVVGTFGSEKRSDYTAIGPTVNLASRIESVCEPGAVYISGEVCDLLPEEMAEEAGEFEFKGYAGQYNLYRLTS